MKNIRAMFNHENRTAVDMISMAKRTAVQRPYFAFDSLYTVVESGWDIWGDFRPEQPLENEFGPISAAEAGRHLAILGACAAAIDQAEDERVYFLAAHADWEVRCHCIQYDCQSTMAARARITGRSPKSVTANTELLIDGVLYATLQVRYQRLAQKTFDKCFSRHRTLTALPGSSPYVDVFPLAVLAIGEDEVIATSVEFSAARCAGHFPEFPMWPVAIVMYAMSQVTSLLLNHKSGRSVCFRVLQATLIAQELVPASEPLVFSASLVSMAADGKHCAVLCTAFRAGKAVVTTHTELVMDQ